MDSVGAQVGASCKLSGNVTYQVNYWKNHLLPGKNGKVSMKVMMMMMVGMA